MVKMTKMLFEKKNEICSDLTITLDPLYIAHGKAKNWKSEFCFRHGQNAFTVTQNKLL